MDREIIRYRLGELWCKTKILFKNKYFLVIFFSILIVGSFLIYKAITKPAAVQEPEVIVEEEKEVNVKVPSKLLGIKVDPSQLDKKVLAVVVENHPDARPQSGLDKASIVYETLAEGGITRFLALFQENKANEIGPVRSARIYFLEWIKEFDAYFAHVGGNSTALANIKPMGIEDLNQFYFSPYFWRDSSRWAPHNVYTTTSKLYDAGKNAKYEDKSTMKGFVFKEDAKKELRPISATLTVNFSEGGFNPTYKYDRAKNVWKRSLNGIPFTDKVSKKQISPKNIIVQYANFSFGYNSNGEQTTRIGNVGSGKALFYIDGKQISGTWKKSKSGRKTQYLDKAGQEIKLNPGQTWIEVIPNGNIVSYSAK